jgi:flagellar biosynthesis/type III secretory pathway M-ring protein FliF/YscJ
MPSAEIWTLFPALGVVVLLLVVIGLGARAMWREYRAWMDVQDTKRSDERTAQRKWEEEQDSKRDQSWQSFIAEMQDRHEADSAADRIKLSELADVIRKLVDQVTGLNKTLSEHIIEDAARFDVLLKPDQKQAVEDVKTQPRKKPG